MMTNKPAKPVEYSDRNWRNYQSYLDAIEEYKMKLQAYYIALAIKEER